MGCLTRSASRRAKNSQPVEPEPPKPQLQEAKSREERVKSTPLGNATIVPPNAQLNTSEWDEPACAPARPTWANADDNDACDQIFHLQTMKPIGQYPSPAEYKSVGLKPRLKTPKDAIQRANKLASRTEDDEDLTTDTPITPVAEEENIAAEILRADDYDQPMTEVQSNMSVKTAVEGAVLEGRMEVEDTDAEDDLNETNLATPVSEAVDASTTFPSIRHSLRPSAQPSIHSSLHSAANSPAITPLDEIDSPVLTLTAPGTHLTVPDSHLSTSRRHSQQSQYPADSTVLTLADNMATGDPQIAKPDYLTVLNSLPVPKSDKYDVTQLKRVLEVAVTRSADVNEDDVALSLVHYWSDISGDEFKLSLIHNIGNDERDHNLELALQTMLRHSIEDASKWYQTYAADNARLLAGPASPTDSSLSSAKSLEPEPASLKRAAFNRAHLKRADIYRDTTGPKLEEAFLNGKTNTAPLKRARKPCRVNENSFKRRREWEADPKLEKDLREKRARLAQDAKSDQTLAESSSVRPQRGQPDGIQHPYSRGDEELDESMLSTPKAATSFGAVTTPEITPSGAGQPRRQRLAKDRSAAKQKEKVSLKRKRKDEGEEKQKEKEAEKNKENFRIRRVRSLSLDTTVSAAESAVSDSCYSDDESTPWVGQYQSRQMPNAINVPENTDYCTICGDEGDLLCCDTCENAFHFGCLDLDKKNPPKGDWFCKTCVVRNAFTTAIAWGKRKRNKTSYSPPQDIKNYFEGVGEEIRSNTHHPPEDKRTHSFYKSVPTIPRLTKPPKPDKDHSNRTPLYDDPNLTKLMENGHVILCNKCGLSSEGTRPIIRCDYCESRFHLDCLDPPMAKPPNPYEGWLCPNHVTEDELVVRKYVDGRVQERRPRRPKKTTTLSHKWDPDQTWDEDFNAQEDDVGSREIVLDFLSTAKFNKKREDERRQKQLESTMLDLTRQMAMDHFIKNGVSLADITDPSPQIRSGITSMLQNLTSRRYEVSTYDAASSLLGLAQGEPFDLDEDTNASSQTISAGDQPEQDESADLETSQNPVSPKANEESQPAATPAPSPAPETTSRTKVRSAPASRRQSRSRLQSATNSPRVSTRISRKSAGPNSDLGNATQSTSSPKDTRKKKRPYAESEPALDMDEPAQKRQHADSE